MTQFSFASNRPALARAILTCELFFAASASASVAKAAILYNNDAPTGSMAAASRPANGNFAEIEAADDFLFSQTTRIDGATFTGLLPTGAPLSSVNDVAVEIYRVFPLDSGPFDNRVVTRANSPSDIAFLGRDSAVAGELTFNSALLNASFTASNSVLNGINAFPNQTTGGEGAVTGEEVQFTLTFPGGITLPANHYFFKPEVGLTSGNFLWLSAARPFAGTGSFSPDLQAWIRNAGLDPDWSRIGTDIVGGATPPTFNMAFSLNGTVVPEPTSAVLSAIGMAGLLLAVRRKQRLV